MGALDSLTQAQLATVNPTKTIYLVDWVLESLTLRLSTQGVRYRYGSSEILYEGYLLDIQGLGCIISDENGWLRNGNVILKIANERWGTYSYLSLYDAVSAFHRSSVTIYELKVPGDWSYETPIFASDIRVVKAKMVVDQVQEENEQFFTLSLGSRLHDKKNKWGGDKITRTLYPYADPNDIGKTRNTIYGSLEKLPCLCVSTGCVDTLSFDIGKTQMLFQVSGVSQIPWPENNPSLVIQIDDEMMQVTYTSSGFYMTVAARGWGGTTVTTHKKGAAVFWYTGGNYLYEIAKHPIHAITAVYVDDILQLMYPYSGYVVRAYTGQPGDELPGYPARAMLNFSLNPKVKKQVNVSVEAEHGHNTATGSHNHTTPPTAFTTNTSGVAQALDVTNPGNAVDGNDATYATLTRTGTAYPDLRLSKGNNDNWGTLYWVDVFVKLRTSGISSSNPFRIGYSSGYKRITEEKPLGWYRFSFGTSTWNGNIGIYFSTLDFPAGGTVYVYEAYAVFNFSGTSSANPAAGVSASISTSSIIQGLSTADIVIGDEVTVDCHGYRDDSYGTITSTPNSLIIRADHVIKHFLINLCGFTSGDIGTSFTDTAAIFAATGNSFGCLVHDIASDADQIISKLARQCRSMFYEWAGKFELKYIPDSAPVPDFTFVENDLADGRIPSFSHSPLSGVANRLVGHYRRDYRTHKANSKNFVATNIRTEAVAPGYMDTLVVSYGAGDIEKVFEFKAIPWAAYAQVLLDFERTQLENPKTFVTLFLNWIADQASPGQYFSFTDRLKGTNTYRIIEYKPTMDKNIIEVKGEKV